MNVLLYPCYFPNIAHYLAMLKTDGNCFLEVNDNYQKQTYRNRCDVLAANGKLSLTIPVVYSQKNRQLTKDIKIFNSTKWQSQHLKTLQSAYRMSPFYEFYEADFLPLFKQDFKYLLDFTITCFELINQLLGEPISYKKTEFYNINQEQHLDFRALVQPTTLSYKNSRYPQVYEQKFGFTKNLSIVDLIFNEGPASMSYLKNQVLRLK